MRFAVSRDCGEFTNYERKKIMKKTIALLLTLMMCISLCACEKEPAEVTETDYITVNGICVDDSYRDKDESPLRMVYLFYTLSANDQNLSIDSVYTNLKVDETNTYKSEYYPGVCKTTPNFYYSSYIQEVYVGTTQNVVATFKIPEADLAAGKVITIEDTQIPEVDKIRILTDNIQHFEGEEKIAEAMDPEGYAAEMLKYEEADESTTATVKGLINGYYWSFYVNSVWYELEFSAENNFELRAKIGGASTANSGTYSVRNGYIFCTYPDTGYTVEIPYEIKDGEIKLDTTTAFDVKSN